VDINNISYNTIDNSYFLNDLSNELSNDSFMDAKATRQFNIFNVFLDLFHKNSNNYFPSYIQPCPNLLVNPSTTSPIKYYIMNQIIRDVELEYYKQYSQSLTCYSKSLVNTREDILREYVALNT
jgi:hypothetical protein